MSNTKTKTKMKSGTIAVIALSIVLVLSLVTTITLAYFTASRNVVTTIQFANGVRIQMGGAYKTNGTSDTTGDVDSPASNDEYTTPATLYWKATYHTNSGTIAGEGTGTYTDVADTIDFEALGVKVIDLDSYVAVRIAVTGVTRGSPNNTPLDMQYVAAVPGDPGTPAKEAADIASYVRPQLTNQWMDFANDGDFNNIAGKGWFVYKGSTNAPAKITATTEASTTSGFDDATPIVSSWSLDTDNSFTGKNITVQVVVFASNTLAGLQETVQNWNTTYAASDGTNMVGYAKLAS